MKFNQAKVSYKAIKRFNHHNVLFADGVLESCRIQMEMSPSIDWFSVKYGMELFYGEIE